ncbi:MAG: DUF6057 family protein, partial [Bacteroidales bacterium]|nr:DUF6057 family protein [Bacteroidales bacterium]
MKSNKIFPWLPYMVFFVFTFIYFGFFSDYVLFYQEKASLFIFSSDFLLENLNQPGGFMIWLGKLFTTFYYYPLAGAAIVSATLTLVVLTISKIIFFTTGKKTKILPLIFGVAIFFLQTDYRCLLYINLGLLLQLALFYLTIR